MAIRKPASKRKTRTWPGRSHLSFMILARLRDEVRRVAKAEGITQCELVEDALRARFARSVEQPPPKPA